MMSIAETVSESVRSRPFRGLIWSILLVAVMGMTASAGELVPAGATQAAQSTEQPRALRVLLVTGGCCHDYATQKNLLKKGLEQRAHVEVTVVHQGGSATNSRIALYEDPEWASGFDVVIHDECFADVKDPSWTQRVLAPHQAGVPAVVLHCAMHCYRDGTDEWFKFCGVTSRRHGSHYAHEVLNFDPTHPVMSEFPAGWANPAGELYWIEKLWPTATPLATARNRQRGNSEVCVWSNQYGQARVFGTTLGHHNETVQDPQYLDLVTRGTLWACGQLNEKYLKTRNATFVPVNLALGRTASASTLQTSAGHLPANAVDGKRSTRWCASDASAPQWWQVDLGSPQTVTGCRLDWEFDSTVYRYRIEGSVDGKDWRTLVDRTQNQDDTDYEHSFTPSETRYVRLWYEGSNTGHWCSLWEMAVHGEQLQRVDPDEVQRQADAALLADVKLPAGFEATLFARPPAVLYPVFVAAAPDGTVYVSVDLNGSLDREQKRGAIYRLRDLDGDGRADEVRLFVPDVDSPRGLVWDHDRLYVMHPPHLSAFIDEDGDGVAERQEVLVKNLAFTFKDRPADHTTNGVTLGIDGWLYLAVGDFGFMQAEGSDGRRLQLRGGGVVRVRPDGSQMELYSNGTRNILEVAVDPLLNGFARDNTNDGGGWDIRLHHFTGLEDHGYPRLFRNFTSEIIQPLADYGGGSGCGALFLDEPGFPAGYGRALYTADWGRQMVYRHQFTPQGATFQADQHEFLGLPRVTDLDADASSSLYAASWKGATFRYVGDDVGYLIRIRPQGYQAPILPDFDSASAGELVELLRSPSHRRRLEAQRALIRRDLVADARNGLLELIDDAQAAPAAKVAAVFALKQGLASGAHEALQSFATDPQLAAFIVRALGDRADQKQSIPPGVIESGLKSADARTRLESLVAAARLQLRQLSAQMIPLLADADPVIAHTAVQALVKLEARQPCWDVIDDPAAEDALRAGALRVLQSQHDPQVVEGFQRRLQNETRSSHRRELLAALCRLFHLEGDWKGDSWGTRPDTRGPYYQPEAWQASASIAETLEASLRTGDVEEVEFLVRVAALNRIERAEFGRILQARAAQDERFIPAVVVGLHTDEKVPSDAVPLFVRVATGDETSAALRSRAVKALLKADGLPAFTAALAGLQKLDQDSPELFRSTWTAVHDRDTLIQHAADIQHLCRQNSPLAFWADAALLVLSEQKKLKGEAARVVEQTLEESWQTPPRRERILEAALKIDHRSFEPRVREAIGDPNPAVKAAALRVADAWKLNSGPRPGGPLVRTLQPADAIAAVLEIDGDSTYGEQVFARLKCNNCHTVRADEPPRGPYLPNVARTYKRQQLAEAILVPSKSIAQGFVTNLFILESGKSVTGFVTSESATQITIRDGEGRETRLAVEEIDERVQQKISMMPEGLTKELTTGELAALIAYLESLAGRATNAVSPVGTGASSADNTPQP